MNNVGVPVPPTALPRFTEASTLILVSGLAAQAPISFAFTPEFVAMAWSFSSAFASVILFCSSNVFGINFQPASFDARPTQSTQAAALSAQLWEVKGKF